MKKALIIATTILGVLVLAAVREYVKYYEAAADTPAMQQGEPGG